MACVKESICLIERNEANEECMKGKENGLTLRKDKRTEIENKGWEK